MTCRRLREFGAAVRDAADAGDADDGDADADADDVQFSLPM